MLPTVRVEHDGGYMVINASDFDSDRYRLYEESPPYPAPAPADGGDDSTQPLPPEFDISARADYLKDNNTVAALRQMARAWSIPGRSGMNEDELATAIAQAESAESVESAHAVAEEE